MQENFCPNGSWAGIDPRSVGRRVACESGVIVVKALKHSSESTAEGRIAP